MGVPKRARRAGVVEAGCMAEVGVLAMDRSSWAFRRGVALGDRQAVRCRVFDPSGSRALFFSKRRAQEQGMRKAESPAGMRD